MTLEQINRFCHQVLESNTTLKGIKIAGGEPLLHNQLGEITRTLYYRLRKGRRLTGFIEILTNGDLLGEVHPKAFEHTRIKVSWTKTGFVAAYVAPKDTDQRRRRCKIPTRCGIVLNAWGYWPCAPGTAIARLFSMPQYRKKELPESLDDFGIRNRLGNWNGLCDLCQWSTVDPLAATQQPEPSPTYQRAFTGPQTFDLLDRF